MSVPMYQGFSHFAVFFASFSTGKISHKQYKGSPPYIKAVMLVTDSE